MAHELPALPYAHDALEPHIDTRTMEIHHGKHHAAYVANLNKALEPHADLQKMSITELIADLERVPEDARGAVRNNGGGHFNHSLFWKIMQDRAAAASPWASWPTRSVSTFGSFSDFQTRSSRQAGARPVSAPAGPGCT